ncbi:nucleotidyltransferase domain-containing protein [Candidatus Dependentiae bacterium]|nr:nucleotidyltransferase domain-containing protein [Candidatus Dependentiae bacterium]
MKKTSKQEAVILKEIFKNISNVYIFGSRVQGSHGKFSDLDICLKDTISASEYVLLEEKLENSDLPFSVDIIEYDKINDSFKKIIDQEGIPLDQFLIS